MFRVFVEFFGFFCFRRKFGYVCVICFLAYFVFVLEVSRCSRGSRGGVGFGVVSFCVRGVVFVLCCFFFVFIIFVSSVWS